MNYQLVTIVLAAGESRRMGKPKLFLPLYGSTMLRLAVQAATSLPQNTTVIVVTGAYNEQIREHLADWDNLCLVHNPKWSSGMSGSIASGVTEATTFTPSHILITLADQPGMRTERLALLVDESLRYPDHIVTTQYPERRGVPAIFPVRFAEALRAQSGTFGARQLIAGAGTNVRVVSFSQPPIDVDTPEDYKRLLGKDNTE